jgi:transcriptional regulator with XRE-family HTH domain
MATKSSVENINLNLKELLRERGVMAKELADYLEITQVGMSNIINNKTIPSVGTLLKIAKFFNVKLSTLLGEEPLRIVDDSKEFAAFIRYKGIHYTADTLEEFFKQVDELKTIAR